MPVFQDVLTTAQSFAQGLSHAGIKDEVTVSLTSADGQRFAALIADRVSIAQLPLDTATREILCAATLGNVTFTWVDATIPLHDTLGAELKP